MASVKWVKITTDMFDNRKIKHIRKLPEGNNIVLIWVMLLSLAGRCNASGMIFLTENIPYTDKMLADELGFDESVIHVALKALEKFGMISMNENDILTVCNWDEYQNVEGLDKIREQNRLRKQKQRERERLELECHVKSRDRHATDIEEEIEEDKEYILLDSKESNCRTEARRCVEAWNSLAEYGIKPVSKIRSDSKRGEMLNARIKQYGVDDVLRAIEKIKGSSFLQGKTKTGVRWFDFEWFVRPNNFPKVLEGKYDDKCSDSNESSEQVFSGRKRVDELGDDEYQ